MQEENSEQRADSALSLSAILFGGGRHQRHRTTRVIQFGVVALLLLVAPGCASGAAPEQNGERGADLVEQQQKLAEPVGDGEKMSPHPILLLWDDLSDITLDNVLGVTVVNTVRVDINVELRLVVDAPNGRGAMTALGTRLVPGGARESLSVDLKQLPIQTVGMATAAVPVAQYEWDQPIVSGPGRDGVTFYRRTAQATAPPRFVTFDPDFSGMTTRSLVAQQEENARLGDGLGQALVAVRVLVDEQGQNFISAPLDYTQADGQPAGIYAVSTAPIPTALRDQLEQLRGGQ